MNVRFYLPEGQKVQVGELQVAPRMLLPSCTDGLEPVSASPTKPHVTDYQLQGRGDFPLDVTQRSGFPKQRGPRRVRLRFAMPPARGSLLQGPDNFVPHPLVHGVFFPLQLEEGESFQSDNSFCRFWNVSHFEVAWGPQQMHK